MPEEPEIPIEEPTRRFFSKVYPDDDSLAFALVTCLECEKKWKDFYKLVTIEEVL